MGSQFRNCGSYLHSHLSTKIETRLANFRPVTPHPPPPIVPAPVHWIATPLLQQDPPGLMVTTSQQVHCSLACKCTTVLCECTVPGWSTGPGAHLVDLDFGCITRTLLLSLLVVVLVVGPILQPFRVSAQWKPIVGLWLLSVHCCITTVFRST
ncbi:hypothetical protein Pelo_13064 [Pelomyxa schiedti]|nr:hypothetical protein Pelo_13064 [Pelomyxa schiedti]